MAKKQTLARWQEELKNRLSAAEFARTAALLENFEKTFGAGREISLFSAPGRTEIGGNHTDHQRGRVLAASVNLDTVAAVSLNGENVIRVQSEGYRMCTVELSDLRVREKEKNTTMALIRGVAAAFADMGCPLQGFDAYIISNVLRGSGLSSSAAFEVLMGVILNGLFFEGKADPIKIAQIGQWAENVYFGKPCGLMDQMACSVGGVIGIDFKEAMPQITRADVDLTAEGYALCILDSGADHADLTGDYAAIPAEMKAVAHALGAEVLSQTSKEALLANLPAIRRSCGDRAVLRALHFFGDDARVPRETAALQNGDFSAFLEEVKASGRSSFMYLQNVSTYQSPAGQEVAVTIALCEQLLAGRGAVRVHGGGFAGTVQAFVPLDMLDAFRAAAEAVLGEGKCHVLRLRSAGGIHVTA